MSIVSHNFIDMTSYSEEKRIGRLSSNIFAEDTSMDPTPGTDAWLAQVTEDILDAERPIIDPHHHLWHGPERRPSTYLLNELWIDTGTGHNVKKTVFVQCRSGYRTTGPEAMKPVGETEFVAEIATQSALHSDKAVVAGIVSYADLRLGDTLDEVLTAHDTASRGLFRGIRHAGASHPNPAEATELTRNPPGLFLDGNFQAGVRQLGKRGYTYESFHFHTQLRDFYALAKAAPDTTIILDHLGMPLGTGSFANQRDAIFEQWRVDISAMATCPNVYVKLGGMAMPVIGFGWHTAATPPTSDELVFAQKRYYLHAIEQFGVHRCMFESNFPVDRLSVSYPVLWNAFKKMVMDFSESEKHALFYGTAATVYRL